MEAPLGTLKAGYRQKWGLELKFKGLGNVIFKGNLLIQPPALCVPGTPDSIPGLRDLMLPQP